MTARVVACFFSIFYVFICFICSFHCPLAALAKNLKKLKLIWRKNMKFFKFPGPACCLHGWFGLVVFFYFCVFFNILSNLMIFRTCSSRMMVQWWSSPVWLVVVWCGCYFLNFLIKKIKIFNGGCVFFRQVRLRPCAELVAVNNLHQFG